MKESAPEKDDKDVLLNDEGRHLAAEKFEKPLGMRFGHVAGSSRIRTLETAVIAATQDITKEPEDLGIGKAREKKDLDFYVDENGEYGKRYNKAYDGGKMMAFLMRESDDLAKEYGDTTSCTYSRMAANIARIIYQNFQAAKRGAAVLEQSKNQKNELNDFERILATHGTIQESFLLKVVEKLKGIEARDAFFLVIGEKWFDFTEGFDVTLSKENGEEKIRITYKKGAFLFDEIVSVGIIEEIISEGAA